MTMTTTLDLPALPELDTRSLPDEFATLGEPWDRLLGERNDLIRRALAANRAYERAAATALEDAAKADRRAAEQAVAAGEPAPGRAYHHAAVAEIERLHAEADALTRQANRSVRRLHKAVRGAAGDQALTELDDQLAGARSRATAIVDELDQALAQIGTIVAVRGVIPASRATRMDGTTSLQGSARRGHDGLGIVHVTTGRQIGAVDALDILRRLVAGADQ